MQGLVATWITKYVHMLFVYMIIFLLFCPSLFYSPPAPPPPPLPVAPPPHPIPTPLSPQLMQSLRSFSGGFRGRAFSLSRPLPILSPSLIGHLASVDVKQHESKVGRGRESERLDRGNRPKKTGETVDRRQNNGSVKAVSPHHCPATCALRNCSFNCCAGQSN